MKIVREVPTEGEFVAVHLEEGQLHCNKHRVVDGRIQTLLPVFGWLDTTSLDDAEPDFPTLFIVKESVDDKLNDLSTLFSEIVADVVADESVADRLNEMMDDICQNLADVAEQCGTNAA